MSLIDQIREAVRRGDFIVSIHARQRLRGRKIALWQVEAGLDQGTIMEVRPDDRPNPSIVVEQALADATAVHAVWSWLAITERAKLVTVYFPD